MRPSNILALSLATVLAVGCARESAAPEAATPAANPEAAAMQSAVAETDEHSYAEPDKVRTTDLALELAIDFDNKQMTGTATYSLDWLDKTATQLVLDTRDLTIESVKAIPPHAQSLSPTRSGSEQEGVDDEFKSLQFALAPADATLGSKLTIQTPDRSSKIRVRYKTSPQASGLQWLEPSMTAGKKTPFMFSQSQQIHARSWVPLQDTPRVRFTYSAHVTAPENAMVLMSADNDPKAVRDGDYTFKMPQKIPSYLLAIAAGDMVFEPISARAGVWAEPSMAKPAAAEFADTEKMMTATEALYGPYRWGRYDILVLPPSFPYGGMENPRLTFATPTVIVGDQSLVSLIAHELAHSWSGNLVTFSSAKDAWLNEGFTSYVENRIIESLYGKERADMERVISRNELAVEFKKLDPKLQALALKPEALPDPDGSSSATVYTKGAWFLQFLEERFGRDNFDAFLKGYFDHFAFQSIPTQTFVDYAKANLLAKYPDKVTETELEEWIYKPGIPASAPKTQSQRMSLVDSARLAWLGSAKLPLPSFTSKWTTQEWVHFVEGMPETLTLEQLKQLDAAYKFTGTPNGEIAQRWYPLTVRSGSLDARPAIGAFLQRIGRRKLIMPTYEALVATTDGLAFAKDVYAKAKPGYHPITSGSVEKVIAEAKPNPSPPAPAVQKAAPAEDAMPAQTPPST